AKARLCAAAKFFVPRCLFCAGSVVMGSAEHDARTERLKETTMTFICRQKRAGIIAAALLTGTAIGGWAMSTMSTTSAAGLEDQPAFETMHKNVIKGVPRDELMPRLTGSYVVSGTDPDGKPYADGIVDIALAASGALELDWNNGKQLGVGQVIGDVLVVGCL